MTGAIGYLCRSLNFKSPRIRTATRIFVPRNVLPHPSIRLSSASSTSRLSAPGCHTSKGTLAASPSLAKSTFTVAAPPDVAPGSSCAWLLSPGHWLTSADREPWAAPAQAAKGWAEAYEAGAHESMGGRLSHVQMLVGSPLPLLVAEGSPGLRQLLTASGSESATGPVVPTAYMAERWPTTLIDGSTD